MQQSVTIQKNPVLSDSSNYELLRKKGLEYIEQLGNAFWTDYNIHDPGITILELLCYAITDLGYRSSLDIKDLLAVPLSEKDKTSPNRQTFFSAAEVLTINPWSMADYRKMLIDVNGVKNAWLQCKETACDDKVLYATCADSKLHYENMPGSHEVIIKGFYDVMLEFDNEDGVGDLNSGKVKYNFSFPVHEGSETDVAMLEMRLPSWQEVQQHPELYKDFMRAGNKVVGIEVNMISDGEDATVELEQSKLSNRIRKPLYATSIIVEYELKTDPPSENFVDFRNVPFNVWFRSDSSRREIKREQIKDAIKDAGASGIFAKYMTLLQRASEVMDAAKNELHEHRNLCEDFCSVNPVKVQEFAVCADMEVEPSADIEAVLAEVYYRVDQYMSPDIKFYSLKQLMDTGVAADEIFEGPRLKNGFINNEELETTNLKKFIYSSDIINLLMDIEGVINIKNFMLTKYDSKGNITEADEWKLAVTGNCQPRLYPEASKILVLKNGLPFLPDRMELSDTLQVIKGKYAQPKYSVIENNLPVPEGRYYKLNEYYPLQYSLPVTYGVGYAGLPDTATTERKAQAKQLKAYLMFFEQLLVNYVEQLANVKELFAADASVDTTYFRRLITENDIRGTNDIFSGFDQEELKNLVEDNEERLDRRNRVLDHLMARFAENFNNYALMLYSFSSGKAVMQAKLVNDKVAFLNDFTAMSHNRGRGINYKKEIDYDDAATVNGENNISGLHLRIQRLLGMDGCGGFFEMFTEINDDNVVVSKKWRLKDENGKVQFISITDFINDKPSDAEKKARAEVLSVKKFIKDSSRYKNTGAGFIINLTNDTDTVIATNAKEYLSKAASDAAIVSLISFGTKLISADKIFVTEHLLLRPRYAAAYGLPPGIIQDDPLLTICIPPACDFCEGETDPYSFRLSIVLSGETGIAGRGMEFRRFAEETIRKEVPAHLGVKVCWVSNEQLLVFETKYNNWLKQLAQKDTNASDLQSALVILLEEFTALNSVYPEATLHDCIDSNDENRVVLGHTAVISDEELDERINNNDDNNT